MIKKIVEDREGGSWPWGPEGGWPWGPEGGSPFLSTALAKINEMAVPRWYRIAKKTHTHVLKCVAKMIEIAVLGNASYIWHDQTCIQLSFREMIRWYCFTAIPGKRCCTLEKTHCHWITSPSHTMKTISSTEFLSNKWSRTRNYPLTWIVFSVSLSQKKIW